MEIKDRTTGASSGSTNHGCHLDSKCTGFIWIHGFFFPIPEEPTALPPYGGAWYDDYDEYGISMKICIIPQMFCSSLTALCLDVNNDFFFPKRKERRWDGWKLDRKGERESSERERKARER